MSVESKRNKAKIFLSEMKKLLSQATFDQIVMGLQRYKTSDNLDDLLSKMAVLTEDANTHALFRGVPFVIEVMLAAFQRDRRRTWPEHKYSMRKLSPLCLRDVPISSPASQETV